MAKFIEDSNGVKWWPSKLKDGAVNFCYPGQSYAAGRCN